MNAYNSKNDIELLQVYARTGDQSAFAELVSRHASLVYRVCYRTLSNRQDAEDASQAVFMTLIKRNSKLHGESLASWLFTVARQTSLFKARTRVRRDQRESLYASESMDADSHPGSDLQTRELVLESLNKELATLSELQREAVILRYLQGLSEKEAATMAGCTSNTLSRRASDGISRLRARFAKRGCTVGVTALIGVLAAESQAAVPETLIPSLIAVPKTLAAGAAASQGAGNIITLMEGTMKMMFMAKMKTVVIGVLVTGLLGAGGVVAVQAQLSKGGSVPEQKATAEKGTIANKLKSIVIDLIKFNYAALSSVVYDLNKSAK